MKRLAIFFILSLLLFAGNPATVLSQDTTSDQSETFVVVFDESHYQYFTAEMMDTALSSLDDALDTDDLDVNIELVVQTDPFNSTNVQGADLVIIGNPGLQNNSLPEIDETEARALDNLVNIGGSVLYLSNPLSHDQNITGHAQPLNNLIFDNFGASMRVDTGSDADNTTLILDEFNNKMNNNSFIHITSDNINNRTLVTELNNITIENDASMVFYGGQVVENTQSAGPIAGETPNTSYVINQEYQIDDYQSSPRWMYGRNFADDQGRALLIGSTIMFSDYSFDDSSTWIEQEQNLQFFQNIVAWLLEITPLPEDLSIVTQPFSFFVRLNVLYSILLALVLFFGTFLAFRGRVSFNQIFDIFRKDTSSKGQSKSSSNNNKKSKQSKKPKRRKRT